MDQCLYCTVTDSIKPVVTIGKSLDYDHWICVCEEHFDKIACKKQICNHCQPKSVIKEAPKICKGCMTMILTNYVQMRECQFPVISRLECSCQYCL